MKANLLSEHTLFEGAGQEWSDVFDYQSLDKDIQYRFPTQINIDYVQFIDRIQVVYSDKELSTHGGGARRKMEIKFDQDEYIQTVICEYCKFGCSAYMICTLLFKTNKKEVGFRSFYQPNDRVKVEHTFPEGYALSCIAGKTDYYNTNAEPCVSGLKLFCSPIKNVLQDAPEEQYSEIQVLSVNEGNGLNCIHTKTINFNLETTEKYLDCFCWREKQYLITYIKSSEKSLDFILITGNERGSDRNRIFKYTCPESLNEFPLSKVFVCGTTLYWLLSFPETTHSCLLIWKNDTFELKKEDVIPNLPLEFNKGIVQCMKKIRTIEIINYGNVIYLFGLTDILQPELTKILYYWHILIFDVEKSVFIQHSQGKFYHHFDSAIFYKVDCRYFMHFIELLDSSSSNSYKCYIYDLKEVKNKLTLDFEVKTRPYMDIDPTIYKALRQIQYNNNTYLLEVKQDNCQPYEYDTKKKYFVKNEYLKDLFVNIRYKQMCTRTHYNTLCLFIEKNDIQFECRVFKLYEINSRFFCQEDWMGDLYSYIKDQKLCDIKIPSTHNSGSFHYDILGRISCQSFSIIEQLRIGVRCFDIRLIVKEGHVYMHHNGISFEDQSFSKALDELRQFITDHPKEFVILNLRKGNFKEKYNSEQLKLIRNLLLSSLEGKICINSLNGSTTFGELDANRRIMLNIVSEELNDIAKGDKLYEHYFCHINIANTYNNSDDYYDTKKWTSTEQMRKMRDYLHEQLNKMPREVEKNNSFHSLDVYGINTSLNLYFSIIRVTDMLKVIVEEEIRSFTIDQRNEILASMNLITLDFITMLEARHIIKLNIYHHIIICKILE